MIITIRILYGALDTILKYMFCQNYFTKKPWVNKKNEFLLISSIALLDISTRSYFNNTIINLLATGIKSYLISTVFFNEKRELKLFVSSIVLLFALLLETIVAVPINLIYQYKISLQQEINLQSTIVTIILLFLEFVIVQLAKRVRAKTLNAGDRTSYLKLTMIPFASIILIVLFIHIEMLENSFNYYQCYSIILILLLINIIHYIVYENTEKLHQDNYDTLMMMQKYEFRDEYYKTLEKHQDEIRIIRHDLKNQLIRILSYKNNAKDEIQSIIDDLVKKEEMNFTYNIGINSLLYVKHKEAKSKNIDCEFNIYVPETLGFLDKDLNSILGNVIDNAIEACELCKTDRRLKLNLITYNNLLIIHIENSTDGKVKNLFTRKEDSLNHGLGSKSINMIIEKYNGESTYQIYKNNFVLDINLWGSVINK